MSTTKESRSWSEANKLIFRALVSEILKPRPAHLTIVLSTIWAKVSHRTYALPVGIDSPLRRRSLDLTPFIVRSPLNGAEPILAISIRSSLPSKNTSEMIRWDSQGLFHVDMDSSVHVRSCQSQRGDCQDPINSCHNSIISCQDPGSTEPVSVHAGNGTSEIRKMRNASHA